MLGSASGSRPSYPGHPPAAYGGLVSLVPDLNSWPSEGARLRRAAVAWSKRFDPLLRHEVEGVDGLDSLGYQTGTSEPQPDEHGRATCAWRDKGPPSRTLPRCARVYPVRACAAEAAASESLRLRMGGCIRACGMHGETLRYRYRTPPAFVSPAHRIRRWCKS